MANFLTVFVDSADGTCEIIVVELYCDQVLYIHVHISRLASIVLPVTN